MILSCPRSTMRYCVWTRYIMQGFRAHQKLTILVCNEGQHMSRSKCRPFSSLTAVECSKSICCLSFDLCG